MSLTLKKSKMAIQFLKRQMAEYERRKFKNEFKKQLSKLGLWQNVAKNKSTQKSPRF